VLRHYGGQGRCQAADSEAGAHTPLYWRCAKGDGADRIAGAGSALGFSGHGCQIGTRAAGRL